MKSDREIEKMVSQLDLGLRRKEKREVLQYSRGLQDGMRLAYLAVAEKLLSEGNDEQTVRCFLQPFMKKGELDALMAEIGRPGRGRRND